MSDICPTDADIEEFKNLYQAKFNIVLKDNQARVKLSMLLRQIEIIYQPVKRAAIMKYENEDKNVFKRTATDS
jgi:hypothetical protein